MKFIKPIFIIFSIIFFGYFIIGQIVLPIDIEGRKGVCYDYMEDVWAVSFDGSKENIKNIKNAENVKLFETVLPARFPQGVDSLCFGGKDIRAYVDGELRYETDAQNTGWFSTTVPEHYMMIPISAEDAGRTLQIEFIGETGVIYQIYIGSELGIWYHILGAYIGEIIVAGITLVLGVLTIVISNIYGIINKRSVELAYLGFGVSYAAVWLVANSVYRQILFSNLSVASDFPFFMVMLIPFPFLIYMNIVQKRRFEKLYVAISCFLSVVIVINICLFVSKTKGLTETFIWVAIAAAAAIFSVMFSFIMDLKSGKIMEYRAVAVGLFGAFTACIIQLVAYFNRSGVFSGVYLAIGLLCLLTGAAVYTIRNVLLIEKDKKAAVLASESKGKFLSSMSHEIRTPINAVLGMDEMILREATDPNIREYALDIQSAGKSLLSLINDILDSSKIESGKMELVPAEYDVSSSINDTMNMVQHKAKEKELYAKLKVDENLPSRLKGDDIRIRQVLVNILNNAVKYTQNGGVELSISGEMIDDKHIKLHFAVTDTGIGIKQEDLPKLYARFERIEEERNRSIEGTGLGMSISLQLLELMNTKLNVKSEYGVGSCFYFDLIQEVIDKTPIGNLSERISEQRRDIEYQCTFSAEDAEILLVDDNSVNRKVVRSLLKGTQIRIDEADSGENCLKMICERKYDIIFLDHMMPGLDGIQTLHLSHTTPGNLNKETPVIALTANAVSGAREMYINTGFTDFLTKPVLYNKLEDMLLKYIPEEKINEAATSTCEGKGSADDAEVSQLLSDISDMNIDYALMLNGDMEGLVETLKEFAAMVDFDIKEVNRYKEQLPDKEGYKQYRVKVHSLKASAMLAGFVYLSGMARTLELAAINEQLDVINTVHNLFIDELQKKKEQLKSLFEETDEPEELVEFNRDLITEQLKLLVDAVSAVDVDRADEIVEILKGFSYPEEMQSKMEEVYAAVMSLDEKTIEKVLQT